MKYGKEFQHILADSHFPEEWKSSAVEYGQLKKLIKDVVSELSGMGLSPAVLHRLLVTKDDDPAEPPTTNGDGATVEEIKDDESPLVFEFSSDEASPESLKSGIAGPSQTRRKSEAPQEVIVDPVTRNSPPSPGGTNHHHHRKFRLRLRSEASPEPPRDVKEVKEIRPISVMDIIKLHEEPDSDDEEDEEEEEPAPPHRGRKVTRQARLDSSGGVKAEYVFGDDASHPHPQIRLHVLATSPPTASLPGIQVHEPPKEPYPEDSDSDDEPEEIPRRSPISPPASGVPASPSLKRLQAAVSPIWALASGANIEDGMRDLSLGEDRTAPLEPPEAISLRTTAEGLAPARVGTPERDFIIPLAKDEAFFNLLTAALTSLSAFHASQQVLFQQSVEKLCRMISESIQPGSSTQVLPTPLTPSPSTAIVTHSSKASKKDLYAWREIFTLWIEAEIFESSSERTRGERTVEQAEVRLQKFANEVVKRKLGDRRTMKGKKINQAWEEFLRLNVLLLDLKRFQTANINAARKILKKHDKRTALTASSGFQQFARSMLSAHVSSDGQVSTWTFYDTSLPHVLLASLTDVLLPILPSLDDYACLICTSIAFKPIRLGCNHLFCVRCLVKMQRAGKDQCPLCRSNVVLLADKNSLDVALMNFMKSWFPKEVKAKQKENELEIAKEQTVDAGMDTRCSIM